MSRMSETWHGPLEIAQAHLEADTPDLQETQCALINAINHIRQLREQVAELQFSISRLHERLNS